MFRIKWFKSNAFMVLTSVGVVTACGGSEPPPADNHPTPAVVARPAPPAMADAPVNAATADRGATLFTERACQACHTVGGGRLVGPDLSGVTTRRSPDWIVAMITNPDSMIRADTTARQLFSEYMTPMANQNISIGDARAILEFLRRSDEAG